jgi:hypothetical protein
MAKADSKITVEELDRKLADITVSEAELSKYFLLDEARSTPSQPALKLNPETVQIPPATDPEGRARSAAILNSTNFVSRLRREARYNARLADGYKGPLLAAEGDSWFQYPLLLKDLIDQLSDDYAIYCRSEAGDTLDNMVKRREYLDALERTGGRILLLSGGGNDMVAGGALAEHLRDFDKNLAPVEYLRTSFGGILDGAISNIEKIVRDVGRAFPNAAVICHGYDYAIPADGKWLGTPMKTRGIKDRTLQKKIAEIMVDRLNLRLRRLADQTPRVTFVDCRNVVGDGRWHDELHPTDAGYADVAKLLKAEVKRLAGRAAPAAARVEARAAPTTSVQARGRAHAATPPAAAAAKGYSLHVGLNLVDPVHYQGWDGALTACEFDAEDMADLARQVGYEAQLILTKKAKRDTVIGAIRDIAAKMKAGDIFLLSYSGHGGQVPDFSGDEALERPDDVVDETLCLFDGQLIDDELYALWAAFPADSRVLVISDCCHSGSNIKARMIDDMLAEEPAADLRPRAMPLAVSSRVARRQRDFYRDVAAKVSAAWGGPATREMALPVSASVRLISACQDNQVALDGLTNGLFTGRMLETWGAGAFQGDYGAFHRAVLDKMPPSQTPNHYQVGQPSPSFDAQRPYDI